jgi:hypothetical protein
MGSEVTGEHTPSHAPGKAPGHAHAQVHKRGEMQPGIADADKKARTGSEREPVRNTPPAGDWNDVA